MDRGKTSMKAKETWEYIHAERVAMADTLAGLTGEQWSTPSWCTGWSVQQTAGHILAAAEQTPANFYKALTAARFKFNVFTDRDAKRLGALGELPGDTEREDHATLHVARARSIQLLAVAAERPVRAVVDDRVEVAQEQEPPGARAGDAGDEVGRAARGRAGHPLGLCLRRQQRGAQRHRLLGAVEVTRRG